MRATPSKSPLLITGGAGYVGSHAVLAFQEAGYPVVVLDDLSTGLRAAVPDGAAFVEGDAGDAATVQALVTEHRITTVVHFAASAIVPESIADPLKYYRNNTAVGASLVQACLAGGVKRFVFSSTAAVYGIPPVSPVSEDAVPAPVNPYGSSKLAVEWMLRDAAAAHDGFRYAALRYFNVAGADPHGRAGQSGRDATHLIKVATEAVVGARSTVTVFGADYDTPDGTCIRDYIHVTDLADTHVAVLRALEERGESKVFNCGYGRGHSVREVLATVEREAGVRLDLREGPRRPGDPPALVSDVSRLRSSLGWTPRYDDLGFAVRTALAWERKLAAAR